MSDRLLLALAQLDPVLGDFSGNIAKLITVWREAARQGADLVITSELYLTGYPPEDMILKPRLAKVIKEALDALARDTASGPAILIGTPYTEDGKVFNAALLIDGGNIVGKTFKYDLPNYGPFDEKRVFTAGPLPAPVEWRGHKIGVMLCEDMWKPEVSKHLKEQASEILIVLNGSPFETGKQRQRVMIAQDRVRETSLPIVYVNQVGGQDELVFEGCSFAVNSAGTLCAQAKAFAEETLLVTCLRHDERLQPQDSPIAPVPEGEAATYQAVLMGLKDYITKNGFASIHLGLSGGIDSALVAALAVDAVGAANVRTVMMPSPYTSNDSLEDAKDIAARLGCRYDVISIMEVMKAFEHTLAEQFMGCEPDVTEENIQARCRGVIMMALSNKSGSLVLATGNKSEMAAGYATLYGDMCGGYAPLKDVYKTEVYKLSAWRNANKPVDAKGPDGVVIPERVLTKAPSAELRPLQTDQDSLPPYATLDDILRCLIEQDLGLAETSMMGHDPTIVRKIYTLLERAEYKRRQAPPGPKVTRRHLTKDRRYPITNRYSDKWRTQQTD